MFDTYEDIFRQRADAYHQSMRQFPQARNAEFSIAIEHAHLAPGQIVCDAPAGGGYLRAHLPADIGQYIAVESAPDFVSHCPDGEQDSVVESALDDIDLPDASVDRLISVAGVHHLESKSAFYKEASRLLKPDGLLVLLDVETGSTVDVFLNDFLNAHNSMGHQGIFLDAGTGDRIAACGFTIQTNEVVSYPWSFDSENDMGLFCRLLFGMDKASVSQVIAGIDSILGRCEGPGAVNLAWNLRLIVAQCRA